MGFALRWNVGIAGVDHEGQPSRGKTIAQRCRRLSAERQIDDGKGERRLLHELVRIVERSGGSYGRPRGSERRCNFHRDDGLVFTSTDLSTSEVGRKKCAKCGRE